MDHGDLVPRYLFGTGVEIGAYLTPIPGIRPFYVDRFPHYAGAATGAEWYGDATDLPFHDATLDYVATSHVLEHVADPIAALREWCRVLKDQGIIYMVVPHRALMFDRTRPLTPVEHMLHDHAMRTTPVDGTHIDEFVFGIDWAQFSPGTPAAEVPAAQQRLAAEYREAIAAGREINIHFHTFEPEQLQALIAATNPLMNSTARIDVLEVHAPFSASRPDGFLLIARVHRPGAPRSTKRWWRRAVERDPSALRADARRL